MVGKRAVREAHRHERHHGHEAAVAKAQPVGAAPHLPKKHVIVELGKLGGKRPQLRASCGLLDDHGPLLGVSCATDLSHGAVQAGKPLVRLVELDEQPKPASGKLREQLVGVSRLLQMGGALAKPPVASRAAQELPDALSHSASLARVRTTASYDRPQWHVIDLERELGTTLFERGRHGITPTKDGMLLRRHGLDQAADQRAGRPRRAGG